MGSCNCCDGVECGEPSVFVSSTGFSLSKSTFHSSVRDDIPDGAESMKWLRYYSGEVNSASYSQERLCDGEGSPWFYKQVKTKSGVYYYQEYDKDDDYTLKYYGGGTDTDLEQEREDACDDPPDNTLVTDTSWTGTWSIQFGTTLILEYEGTDINGDPVTGSLSVHAGSTPSNSLITTSYSLVASPEAGVVQTRTRSWDGFESGRQYTGNESVKFGYESLSPFTVEIEPPGGVRFMQVKYTAYIVPFDEEAEEVEVDSGEWIFKSSSDPETLSFTPTVFGTLKLVLLYRCSRKTPFKRLIAEQ